MSTARICALHGEQSSIVIELCEGSAPVWRHLGARINPGDLPPLDETRGSATYSLDKDVPHSLFPPSGLGWFGKPVLELRDAAGRVVRFLPDRFEHVASEDALVFAAADSRNGLSQKLTISLSAEGWFTFRNSITNDGEAAVMIDAIASCEIPLPTASDQIISWRGRHNAELTECREKMPQHSWERASRRGQSGHGGPPGVYVLGEGAGHHAGLVIAAQLAWSGSNSLHIERDDEGRFVLQAAATLQGGEPKLQAGETYAAPDMLLAISTKGRNGAVAQMHAAIRAKLDWPGGQMKPRPVHLNSWEAMYFAHDEASAIALAESAAELGVERFILDDGWFAGRHNDMAALGDWTPDPVKYPNGLKPVGEAVRALGMEFGLWVEPEMVSPDSDLYRAHPDWALHETGRANPTSRGQLVLNMRLPEVRDYLFEALDAALRDSGAGYLKWDHNRDHAPGGGAAQARGTYDLLERIRAAHPHIEIEGCAGGGGRSDAGMVPYVHRFWPSDTTDAVSRIGIQRGFQAFLPPEIMGAHIGAVPAHTTGRTQTLAFRAAIACMGHFGVELDPRRLDAFEKAELREWIAFYKRWRDVLHGGKLDMGETADGIVWQAQGNETERLLFVIREAPMKDRRPQPLALPFAAERGAWDVKLLKIAEHNIGWFPPRAAIIEQMKSDAVSFTGSWLADAGLPIPSQRAESAAIFHLKAKS